MCSPALACDASRQACSNHVESWASFQCTNATAYDEASMTALLTSEIASKFANLALAHLTREYPNKLTHSLDGPQDVQGPRALHPIFYGSYDWHSCVHGYWLLLHLIERFPEWPEAPPIGRV